MKQEAPTEEKKDPMQDASLFRAGRKSHLDKHICPTKLYTDE
jgi:hypothetical protein